MSWLKKILRGVTSENKSTNISADGRSLMEKHQTLLNDHLSKMRNDSFIYHTENMTRDFLQEALSLTGHGPSAGEYYSQWIAKKGLPSEVRSFAQEAHALFKARHDELEDIENNKRRDEVVKSANAILDRHSENINKFLEIAFRKVTIRDDYGDENKAALNDEIVRLLKKIGESDTELGKDLRTYTGRSKDTERIFSGWSQSYRTVTQEVADVLKRRFEDYYKEKKADPPVASPSQWKNMTGVEFEKYIMDRLCACGVQKVGGTPTTGDQGADILFSHAGKQVAVQVKRYSDTVGNKAIQEVYAAKAFYKCDEAWVITNSRFSNSALELATQLGVKLVDGQDLLRFESVFAEHFEINK